MSETTYRYQISTDVPSGAVDPSSLDKEIVASAITIALQGVSTFVGDGSNGTIADEEYLNVTFKAALPDVDKGVLDGLAAQTTASPATAGSILGDHTGVADPVPPEAVTLSTPLTNDSRIRVAIEKSDRPTKTFYTHNWADPTTWIHDAVRVVGETFTVATPTQSVFNLAHENIIDSYHGKITQEDDLLDKDGFTYRVSVTVDDVAQTEEDPHFRQMDDAPNGDFVVNYAAGEVTFHTPINSGQVVKVTYHYANGSTYYIEPSAGRQLIIDHVDTQFSSDVVLTDTAVFQTYGFVEAFAPFLLIENGGPYPRGTKIPIKRTVYKTIFDYQNDATKSYPEYPPIGAAATNNWRGVTHTTRILNWDYVTGLVLHSVWGMEVRVYMAHHTPFDGTYATTTLYCQSEEESKTAA